jgi:tetratricopeptide (TPR) repeat protein
MNRFWPASLSLALALSVLSPLGLALAQAPTSTQQQQQLFNDAFNQQNKGNYSKALALWTKAIDQNPVEPAGYVNRGITRYYLKDLRGAVEDLGIAISKKPDYIDAYYNRGTIRELLKDYAGALEDFEKYRELVPAEAKSAQLVAIIDGLRKKVTATTPPVTPTTPVATTPTTSPVATVPPTTPSVPTTPPPKTLPVETTPPVATEPSVAPSVPFIATAPTQLPPGVVSLGKISGYDATTEDLLLGLKLSVSRKLLTPSDLTYKYSQNFVAQMKKGATIDQALKRSGLGKQSMLRLAWRGAAWRTYKVFIR